MKQNTHFAAFLRGINVGGHHKVPMATLRQAFEQVGAGQVRTLLNSGNVVFEGANHTAEQWQSLLESHLAQVFGFAIPTIVIEKSELAALLAQNPFGGVALHPQLRLYVSFLKKSPERVLALPYHSPDGAFQITHISDKIIYSVLDLSQSSTPKGMDELEKLFGNEMTTRNWNTMLKMMEM